MPAIANSGMTDTSTTDTSTTERAREHARAQAGKLADFQRTLPIGGATKLPEGVAREDMIWEETVGPGNYAVHHLPRGARLRLTDQKGDASAQLIVFNAHQTAERLNVADTVKIQWQAYFGQGQLLLSDLGRVLMSAVSDTSAGHDTFNAMSNLAWNTKKYGSGAVHGPHPNARDLMAVALTKCGLERRDICPGLNLFKKVIVEEDGTFAWFGDESPVGGELVLRCETDVLVAITVTPHVLDPRPDYITTPVEIAAWHGEPTAADDPIRNASPEGQRAFENTEYYIASTLSND